MEKPKVLILIPARYQSSRFPGKPLVKISGKSMIEWVVSNLSQTDHEYLIEAVVVTDDERIEKILEEKKYNVVRVDDDVISGTLRIQLAYERFFSQKNYDLVINVQGDEPLLKLSALKKLIKYHLENKNFDIGTMVRRMQGLGEEFQDPNKVKAVFAEQTGKCLYFSRAPVPFCRDNPNDPNQSWFLHIGVYSFKPQALNMFKTYPLGKFEDLEKLEQLKALEYGMSIGAVEMNEILMGVDHPTDVSKVEEVLNGRV